jgi:hypothetical protein
MSEGTPENEIDVTKASAHLPGLDIDIIYRQSPHRDWEQISINLRATPSFEAVGQFFQLADPFTLWAQAARLMWMPWLLTAQTMGLGYRADKVEDHADVRDSNASRMRSITGA